MLGLPMSEGIAAQQTAAERDSVATQMAAVAALRQFQYQYGVLVRGQAHETRGSGACEIRVADFCYGPTNGRTAFGGLATYLAHRYLAPASLPRMWRRTSEFYINRYMTELQRLQRRLPGDRWMNAELVRMHIEHGYLGRAEDAVKRCRDVAWWCAALNAYVMHTTGDWWRADSAWSGVLVRMTQEERCAWLDPSVVIQDRELRRTLEEYSCAELEQFAMRFWWLSDPFFSRPGNERRSAHFSRITAVIIDAATQDRVRATPAMVRAGRVEQLRNIVPVSLDKPLLVACGNFGRDDMIDVRRTFLELLMNGYAELVSRAGVPLRCGPTADIGADCMIGLPCPPPPQFAQYPLSRQSFVPLAPAPTDHLNALPGDWRLRDRMAYEFMHGWTRSIVDLTHQDAHFRRGDSSRLVVVAELPPADAEGFVRPATNRMRAELWLQSDYDEPHVRMTVNGNTRVLFDRMVAPQRVLASVESEHAGGPFGRVRFGTGPQSMPAQRVTISDILLLDAGAPLPGGLNDAARVARPNITIREGQNAVLGVFWEMYGLLAGETPRISILAVRQSGREALRLGRNLTRTAGPNIAVVEWTEAAVAGSASEARSLNLSLATLQRGTYTLSIAVSVPGQELVESVRTIHIVR
jgi:hypothetical protein